MLSEFIEYISKLSFYSKKRIAKAYDLWAQQYDDQPGNLVLDLDENIFSSFLENVNFFGKKVIDIGCGTGRHWNKILEKKPQRLVGYDVSEGMLQQLKKKFPEAETYLLSNDRLPGLEDRSSDILVSTLAIAHIENINKSFEEWDRILKPGADIIITDYHPEMLKKGGKRTFHSGKKNLSVKSFIHPIEKIHALAKQLQWDEMRFAEIKIDDTVRSYYEKQNALGLFERFKGTPLIYAIHFKKKNDTL